MPDYKIGTNEEWQAARDELAKLEAEHAKLGQRVFATNPITAAGANRDAGGLIGADPYRPSSRRPGELRARLFARCGQQERRRGVLNAFAERSRLRRYVDANRDARGLRSAADLDRA